jgi:hypothetical protein
MGVKVTPTVQVVVELYVSTAHVPPPLFVKSRLGAPLVTTSMLPTAVPLETLYESETELGELTATEPKFCVLALPV